MTGARYKSRAGGLIFVEYSDALPLFQLSLTLRSGSLFDPPGKEGLSRLAARMWRMGTRRYSAEALEDQIDALGAQLSVGVGRGYTQVSVAVVERNLASMLELLAHMLEASSYRVDDLAQQKRETVAALATALDDDGAIAGRHFRRLALDGHPYGRPVTGTRDSVVSVSRKDVIDHVQTHLTGPNLLLGLSGPMEPERARDLLEHHFAFLPSAPRPQLKVPVPKLPRGRRLFLIDKPERTQTQVIIGTVGCRSRDPEFVPLVVANTGFGGLFTSRLTTEVRAKRGWSYGASSGFGHELQRDLWSMRTAPAEKDARACIQLQLDLLERWIEQGLSARELKLAKNYLTKSHPFESDTANKRLEHAMDQVLFDVPDPVQHQFPEMVGQVDRASALTAVQKRISRRDQLIVVVGTAGQLHESMREIGDVQQMEVVPFDAHW